MEEEITFVGTVKWFSSKGQPWGYISYQNNGNQSEVFVHYKNISDKGQENPSFKTLTPGQIVEFIIGPGHFCSGTQAINVVVVGKIGTSGSN